MNTVASFLIISLPAPVRPVVRFAKTAWIDAEDSCSLLANLVTDFSEIRVTVDRWLSSNEVVQASGALGYALRSTLCGEELSEPHVIQSVRAGQTILIFSYDSTKSRRDDPDFVRAFEVGREYIQGGSPLRLTNRAGAGTKGTRLVAGIGKCKVSFAVR